ncbi:MAG: hypothetical protein OXF08_06960 [Bacteroidetes bacterium]|nr:hypothetical protein [Bacteroidota bacterium]
MPPLNGLSPMMIREFIYKIEYEVNTLFNDYTVGLKTREDSCAFGTMIEKRKLDNWETICINVLADHVKNPGRRTIYDFACRYNDIFFGFDLKTKDLDTDKYSDGGVCSIGNLMRFLANDRSIFVVIEFGHHEAPENKSLRELDYIKVAPFHLLPANSLRIENLGTGQVRLNDTIAQVYSEIDWEQTLDDFFDFFVELAINIILELKIMLKVAFRR